MDDQQWLSERFEEYRSRLRAVAYRMLGSLSDADDAVQETWLRSARADTSQVENLGAWLTTIVARVSLNMLRARQARPEEPLGPRVPEPIVDPAEGTVPEHEALLADAVGLSLLVVLQTLSPAERLAYVLHDMFDLSFDEIAPIVERTPQAARQLASRARRRVRSAAPPQEGDLSGQREVVDAYITASRDGDIDSLIAVLHPDVLLRVDSGGGRPEASIEVHGAAAVARRSQAFMRLGLRGRPALINGAPGAVFIRDGQPYSVVGFTVTTDRITEIDIFRDPRRLQQLDLSALDNP
jgi:RNA polymerase sigma factor (sigma-70 family)